MLINYKSCAVYQADIPNYIFTVNPTPADAIVTLTAPGYTQAGNSITVPAGTNVSYSVAKSNCITTTGSETVTSTHTTNVSVKCELTVNPTPSDATVTLTASGYSQSGNTITVNYGTIVSCTVSRTELETFTNSYTLTSNQTENVTLSYPSDTVLFESSTPGTYSVTPLTPGTYNVICVGGGGGAAGVLLVSDCAAGAGGGSGGYSNSNILLQANVIQITVGDAGSSSTHGGDGGHRTGGNGGTSSVDSLISAAGGNGGDARAQTSSPSATGGSGGSGLTTNGNSGTARTLTSATELTANGGSSIYNGYGRGASVKIYWGSNPSVTSTSTPGYVKITAV